ncbi:homeobox protein ATH1-like [Chenopodium quinoa]|uniref:homeobox protein ATH1-like n=1 Tax=Chenopodium quinoa TaxID=63459 RepID=UPI000B772FE2|nr:homeobox protein ATH1-like [Chenopodium quinoa]XP_021749656.1 homeobox protein ATH1-like [Chenopodium quinoa]XP_021749657.1 homeobox protein ATH1-like [Chenopodium quinoa]XP_021749658.1 homeobox protein ATH1-like [Chenopodium quinoa]XP_021749659.1 homeobox protein ATH1-like [Chenopodium quinoa]
MESEPHMQLDLPSCIPSVIDGMPQSLSESHFRTAFFQLHTQNDGMLGLPSLQGQSFKDMHADKTVSYDGLINRGNFNYEDRCLGDASFTSGSLPNIIATRNGLNNDVNNSIISLEQEVSYESLRAMFSGGCSYASSSSIPNNSGYDGLFGDVNDKWDHNRFLMQQEMHWRPSTSELEPIRFNGSLVANNEWVMPSSTHVCTSHPYGTSRSHNELSLSLATCGPSLPSDLSCSDAINSSQSQTRLGSECKSHRSKELSLGSTSKNRPVQFPPVTSGSRYVSVLQQILSEVSSYSLDNLDKTSYKGDKSLVNSSSNHPFSSNNFIDPGASFKNTNEFHDNAGLFEVPAGSSKRSQMLALLQMVDDRYNRCLDEIHMVISAFHAATELDPQLHSCFALQTISFFYKNLRERISNQILAMGMENGSARESGITIDKSFIHKQWAIQQLKRKDQLWRPQRGLPERSVSVLRAWMFDNFLHPYPKDAEKHLLAIKSGLTRSQVSNWFINARVRLWKPLVEDMCAEIKKKKASQQNDEGTSNSSNNSRSQLRIYDYDQRFSN